MGLNEAVIKARELCASGKIKVYYFDRDGPVEETDSYHQLKCIFSDEILFAFLESLEPQCLDGIAALNPRPKIKFKKLCEIGANDFEPLLNQITPGGRMGIQMANPSLARQLELINYKRKYGMAQDKKNSRQQLSREEEVIYSSFAYGDLSGIPHLDFTKSYWETVDSMAEHALLLAYSGLRRGIEPVLALCLDDSFGGDSLKLRQKLGLNQETLEIGYQDKLAAFRDLLKQKSNKDVATTIYKESDLYAMLCLCDFCSGRPCPTRASSAVQKLIDSGCNTVVNFYVEDDGPTSRAGKDYERIERGMLHRIVELKDETLCCNIYFGTERAFMVVHNPG